MLHPALKAFAFMLFPVAAAAQDQTVRLSWGSGGELRIEQPLTLPNGCYHQQPAIPGPPEGQPDIANTVAVTFPVTMEGEVCTQMIRDVTASATLPSVSEGTVAVIVYQDWPRDGITATAYSLPESAK